VRVFEGKWEGAITGKPGKQFGSREYQFVLGGTFLTQRDHSVYETKSPDATPKVRDDFGYFSYVVLRQQGRARCGTTGVLRAGSVPLASWS
jgi:hypothetical protein